MICTKSYNCLSLQVALKGRRFGLRPQQFWRRGQGQEHAKIDAKTWGGYGDMARYGDRIKEVGRWRRRIDRALFIAGLTAIIVAMLVVGFWGPS